ncbi:MAG: HDIG domain-containing protein, partial [Clostridiales bacterium]|nr:HDIG domain-containing protein [Clostridiales bacterium]
MKRMKVAAKWRPALPLVLTAAGAFLAMYAMLAAAISPERYDLRVGEVSPIKITATKDVVDSDTTSLLIEQALLTVRPSYRLDDAVAPTVLANIEAAFQQLKALRPGDGQADDDLARAQQLMEPVAMDQASFSAVLAAGQDTLDSLSADARLLTQLALDGHLSESQVTDAARGIADGLRARGYDEALRALAGRVVDAYLVPNLLLDEAATEAARQAVSDSVEPVIYKMGQTVVDDGQVITRSQYEVLDALGLLKDRSFDLLLYVGLALLLLLLLAALSTHMSLFERPLFVDARSMALLLSIMVLTLAVSMLVKPVHSYLMPVALGTMLVTILMKPRVALIFNVVMSVLAGLVAAESGAVFTTAMFCVMITSLVSGTAAVAVIGRRQVRTSVMLAGLVVALTNALTTFAVGLINNANTNAVGVWAAWAAGSGILSAVLCIGLQPALEWVFNLLTATKLIELSSPNHPLLRRLMLEAPGTYHHSIIVANLSEAAANAIGANGLLARVGAYYHDTGKLKRPMYFKENQMGDNPHDRTDPMVSTAILTAHPRDGVQMAARLRIPQPILDIIAQHHGDTPVMYFYDRAVKQNGGQPVDV